ncbi:hypothetical protein DBV15_05177 [Temnothorax longispinosus]|uniref:Uncharacterized protein n=1 Tax=Temnothorax longispinosus TaxID=300112 RepID=A0A4S2KX68_9HYME|nr:hypothetical protein DBV15_05177 [Temnothorax longispinosus]
MKKRNEETRRKKSPSHKPAVISETNFTNQPARTLSEFFWQMLKRDAENAEVKECVISQFRKVGGPDTSLIQIRYGKPDSTNRTHMPTFTFGCREIFVYFDIDAISVKLLKVKPD